MSASACGGGLSAASGKLGTPVRVTNLSNGRRIIVRVNDRGPFVEGRIIDLSYGTAKRLGFVKQGLTKVKLEYYFIE